MAQKTPAEPGLTADSRSRAPLLLEDQEAELGGRIVGSGLAASCYRGPGLVAGARNGAADGERPDVARGRRFVDELGEGNRGLGDPGVAIVGGRDVPNRVPGSVAPAGVARPAAMVDSELVRGCVVAIDIEPQANAVVLREVGIARARRVARFVIEVGGLGAADGDVEKLIVVRDRDLRVGLSLCLCI